ncbi:phosphatidylinositol 5-phosphate 4-kinase type-2 gamma [Ictalurus punctatus]|uniref:Phosphatidylinositol 5-phosphate 4-kinase type-2 gamma n=1 Tax=Ictalurus punctatus TaxID=7998 RepID=W5UJ65_ICTPU|nr:phosphatidylinositol 5-phosphate 4-kinase type-2 gamma [Ictalurus punctatus]
MASPKPGSVSNPPPSKLRRTKSKKKHFVHQKVEVFRASDPVLSVFMWGINHTVSDMVHVPAPVMLLPDDFKANSKIKVNYHLFNKENLPGHFKFKEYCPQVFRNLRERFGIEDQDYQASLVRSSPLKDSDSQDEHLQLTSYDRLLIIKQISSEEVEDMHNILSEYHQHIVKSHGVTLLPQFLGMYRVTVNNEDTYFIIMRNMFSHRLTIHTKYNLKGSLVSREASDKEKEKDLPTFKDMDFRNNMQRIYISDEEKEKLMEKLNRDIDFLVRLKLMDYSLLLAIHEMDRGEREEEEEDEESACEEEDEQENNMTMVASASLSTSPEGGTGSFPARRTVTPAEFDPRVDVYGIQSAAGAPQREVYFMGLINILTHYDTKKKAAHAAKTVKHGTGAEISTVHPEQYGKRFLEFIANIFTH